MSEAIRLNNADVIKLLCQNKRVNIFHEDWATKDKLEDMFESEVFYPLLVRLRLEKEGPKELEISKRNKRGDSFLHMAVLSEQPDAITYFCQHTEVDHQAKNENGSTAFDLIFPPGVDIDTCICRSNSILQIACRTGGKDVVSRKDSEGRTVLHLAVLEGDKEAVKTLYNENKDDIDINAADAMGNTPFYLAMINNMEDIALFLLSKPGVKIDVSDDFKYGIFQIFRRIVIKKESENSELSFVLENYLTEEAVPEGRRGTVPYTLEKLFDTADDKTSILSELHSKIDDENCGSDVRVVCTALLNVIVIGLQQYANHKRLQYLFFKGSVYKTFVQIFVDLGTASSNRSDYLAPLLRILYISTQANIKCNFVSQKDIHTSQDPENADHVMTNKCDAPDANDVPKEGDAVVTEDASDKPNESSIIGDENSFISKPDITKMSVKANDEFTRSLQIILGKQLYAQFRERIEKISEMRSENNSASVSDLQLIAKGIYCAYFKDKEKEGCWDSVKNNINEASDWLSSKIRLKMIFHKCICRGNFAFIFCFLGIFVHTSDVYSDARFGLKTLDSFSKRLGITMILLVFATLIHENIRSLISAYAADEELLRITLGKNDLSDADLKKYSELNYYNDKDPMIRWIWRFIWPYKVRQILTLKSAKPLCFNILSISMLRPIVDRLIVLTHSPSHLRAIYRQQSKQKSLNQYYMILEQMPELLIQFYVFQIYFNNLTTPENYNEYGCTNFHSFGYRTEYFECVENLWRLQICAPWWEIYSMIVPFVKIPNSMVSLEEMFRKLSPETPKMSTAASVCLYIAYIFMIPSRLFLFAAVMHSATDHLYVVAYLGAVTCVWLAINVFTLMGQKTVPEEEKNSANKIKEKRTVKYYIKTIWSLLLFTIRDVVVISLRQADAYFLSPSEVNYKTLRTWRRMLAISSCYFVEGVVGAVYVEHYYPCGRNTEIFKYQGWLYLITLIVSVTIITLLSYILQPAKINIIPQLFDNRAGTICLCGLLMWAVEVIVFQSTTTNSAHTIRLPLIIITLIILSIFLVVVVVLKLFSEAKRPKLKLKEKKNGGEDLATTEKSLKNKSCCILKFNCCLCCPEIHESVVNEQSSGTTHHQASKQESTNKNPVEQTAVHKLLFPVFLGQRNSYEEVSSVEDIDLEMEPTANTVF